MNDKTGRTRINNFMLTGLLLAMAACGDGGGAPDPNCRLSEDGSTVSQCNVEITVTPITLPGGIWRGIDSGGRDVFAFVTEFGRFQFVDGFGNQGSGNLDVKNGDTVASIFQLVTQLGATFADGTTLADCTFSGTIIARQALTMTESCMTTAGLQFVETLLLTFDALYNRDASLATIAGMYETPVGSILSIASDGVIFVQDAVSSCVTNGQMSLTFTTNANLYNVQYQIDNCIGPDAIWNGSSFAGLAVLDNTFSPESLTIAVIGDVGGVAISLVVENERL